MISCCLRRRRARERASALCASADIPHCRVASGQSESSFWTDWTDAGAYARDRGCAAAGGSGQRLGGWRAHVREGERRGARWRRRGQRIEAIDVMVMASSSSRSTRGICSLLLPAPPPAPSATSLRHKLCPRAALAPTLLHPARLDAPRAVSAPKEKLCVRSAAVSPLPPSDPPRQVSSSATTPPPSASTSAITSASGARAFPLTSCSLWADARRAGSTTSSRPPSGRSCSASRRAPRPSRPTSTSSSSSRRASSRECLLFHPVQRGP